MRGRSRLELDDSHPGEEEGERAPLLRREAPAEEEDREEGGGEDLEVVGNLERWNVQVGGGNVLELRTMERGGGGYELVGRRGGAVVGGEWRGEGEGAYVVLNDLRARTKVSIDSQSS